MKTLFILFTLCVLSACEPVDFTKRKGLSIEDKARAIATLRQNAAAFSAGDMDGVRATQHPDALESPNADALIERYAPEMTVRDVKFIEQRADAVVFEYVQSIRATRGHLEVGSAQVRTTLRRMGAGWGIMSSDVLSLSR